jgi:proline iminopeptidase
LLFVPYPHGASVVGDARFMLLVEGLVDRLGRQVITFDPPGSGRSTRPARLDMPEMLACAEETLARCGSRDAVDAVGHSQGGLAALALAVERPARVRRLVLVCTAGGPSYMRAPGSIWRPEHPDFWRAALPALLYRLTGRRAFEQAMLNATYRASFADRRRYVPRPIAARDLLRPAGRRMRWNLYARRWVDYRDRLGTVRAPTLVIAGRCDPQMPPACAEELARGIPGARLVVFERSGHYPFAEEAAAFWAAVGDFLGEPEYRGGRA